MIMFHPCAGCIRCVPTAAQLTLCTYGDEQERLDASCGGHFEMSLDKPKTGAGDSRSGAAARPITPALAVSS